MRIRLEIAESSGDVLRCRQLVAEVYNRRYGVVFSRDTYDLDRKIEPWPHRFLMGKLGDELAAVCGLYMRNTYVERFGLVTHDEVAHRSPPSHGPRSCSPGMRRSRKQGGTSRWGITR